MFTTSETTSIAPRRRKSISRASTDCATAPGPAIRNTGAEMRNRPTAPAPNSGGTTTSVSSAAPTLSAAPSASAMVTAVRTWRASIAARWTRGVPKPSFARL